MQRKPRAQNKNANIRRRSAGHSIVGLIAILFFAQVVIMSLEPLTVWLSMKTTFQSRCENHIYKIEHEKSEAMNELFALNPRAAKLRAQFKLAQKMLATARLAYIQALRIKLDLKQRRIIQKANAKSKANELQFRRAMEAKLYQLNIAELPVIADIPLDTAPIYIEKPGAQIFNISQAQYRLQLKDKTRSFRCSAGIALRGPYFRATLRAI